MHLDRFKNVGSCVDLIHIMSQNSMCMFLSVYDTGSVFFGVALFKQPWTKIIKVYVAVFFF